MKTHAMLTSENGKRSSNILLPPFSMAQPLSNRRTPDLKWPPLLFSYCNKAHRRAAHRYWRIFRGCEESGDVGAHSSRRRHGCHRRRRGGRYLRWARGRAVDEPLRILKRKKLRVIICLSPLRLTGRLPILQPERKIYLNTVWEDGSQHLS